MGNKTKSTDKILIEHRKAQSSESNLADDPWNIFEYEVEMYFAAREILRGNKRTTTRADIIGNALTESAILHTRVLVDIILDREADDDISLSQLLPNKDTSQNLLIAIENLREAYGHRGKRDSPYWTLNKMLAHPSALRSNKYNYSSLLKVIDPIIASIIQEIVHLSNKSRLKKILSSLEDSSSASQTYTHTPITKIITRKIDRDS